MKLMFATLPTLLMFLLLRTKGDSTDDQFTALKFGGSITDYILFQPDMEPLQNQFSICAWVKKLRKADTERIEGTCWLSYAAKDPESTGRITDEIVICDSGRYSTRYSGFNLENSFTTRLGKWYHICMTWSSPANPGGGVTSVYLNGTNYGNSWGYNRYLALDLQNLPTGGYLMLGNDQDTLGGGASTLNIFGGELYKLNFFSKKLNDTEIREMAENKCGLVEQSYGEVRHIKWEDILAWDRNGANVQNTANSGCSWEKLNLTEKTLLFRKIKEDLDETKEELDELRRKNGNLETQLESSSIRIEEEVELRSNLTSDHSKVKNRLL